jgi:hypothetical protein
MLARSAVIIAPAPFIKLRRVSEIFISPTECTFPESYQRSLDIEA